MVEDMAKICTICGEDCAARPRVKDVEGNYFCKPCLNDRQHGRSAGGPPRAVTSEGTASAFLDASTTAADALWGDLSSPGQASVGRDGTRYVPCMQCGSRMKPEAVLCTSCGFNPRRGKRLSTRITKEKEAADPSAISRAGGWGWHMALAAVGGLIGGGLAGLLWIGVALVGYYVLWLGLLIGAGAGKGASHAAGDHRGLMSGLIGACMAAATFLGAQYGAYSIYVEAGRTLALKMVSVSDDDIKYSVYEEVFDELEQEGHASRAQQYDQTEYPKLVTDLADRRLESMTESAKNARRSELLRQRKLAVDIKFDGLRKDFMSTEEVDFGHNRWLAATGVFLYLCLGGAVLVGFVTGTGGEFS